jgi:alpha-1,2-mannosyltransferase
MKRPIVAVLYTALLVGLALAWVRSAWLVPLRNYPFDFSINFTGARLLSLTGGDGSIYDRALLAAEAAPYTGYEALYTKLFLTYIQSPLTAVLLIPLSGLSLDDAQLVLVAISNLLLVGGAALMVIAFKPTKLLIFAAFLIFATFEAMFDSLRLGQVDGLIVFLLALAFLAYKRGWPWLSGVALAGPAMLKVSPAIVVGYFLWRREWRVVAGAALGGLALLALSIGVAGWHNHVTFVRETLPSLSKGSTFYDNVSLGGALARAHFGESSWYYEDEVPDWPPGLRLGSLLLAGAIVVGGYLLARRDTEAGFMLSTVAAVLVAPIAWSFYPTWLIPSLLFLVHRYEVRRAWPRLALLALLYPLLAIVPAHFSTIDEDIYRYPIKTAVLALYWCLLAWEAVTPLAAREPERRRDASPTAIRATS